MFEERWLYGVDELGKVKELVKYMSRQAPETFRAILGPTTYVLICLVDYISEERKQYTFNTQ